MINKRFLNNQNYFLLVIFLFSLSINQYYGNRGIFPIESTAFFDTSYRILQGDVPFKDFWIVSGVFIDYVQAVFFWLFGLNFQVYIFHASLINGLISIMTFLFLINLQIEKYYSFIYAILFSVLAYTTSGTLYVDNHASLLCVAAFYSFIFGITNRKKKNFFLVPIFIGVAFLTKSAPTIYMFLSLSLIILFYILQSKKFEIFFILIVSSICFLTITLFFILIFKIPFDLILDQYFYFPMTVADERYANFTLSFKNIFLNFKFIYVFIIPLIILNVYKIYTQKNYIKNNNFFIFLSFLALSLSLMFHQLNTKNQLFILFLIPLACAILHSQLELSEVKRKKLIINLILILSIIFTIKYHFRYNEQRKFHEMSDIDFKQTIGAKKIDQKLSGLNWISPLYKNNPKFEIEQLVNTLEVLKKDKQKKMIITNYSFVSVLLNENSNSPSRWYISNGAAYPIINNRYYELYKRYLINLIESKKIEVIYVIKPVAPEELFRYVNNQCFTSQELTKIAIKYELKTNCKL